ncbi:hypothetical protein BJ912DRAFT_966109 [Pholiota molesta]|nr:hypothetical protein BJ912DRAFT_966109 [Pholiota molesta]
MVRDINAIFLQARTIAFGAASLFGFLVLALGAAIANHTSAFWAGKSLPLSVLEIALGILTLLSLPPMLFLSTQRKGVITNKIAFELAWTWVLCTLWCALALSSKGMFWFGDCSTWWTGNEEALCHESRAVTAFTWITWIILYAYNNTLFLLASRQHIRGNTGIWRGYVTETDFITVGPNSSGVPAKSFEAGNQHSPYPAAQQASPYPQAQA